MSFILDALKKSETDRQRQSGPSLFEVKVAPPRRRLPVWAVAIAVLLGINLVLVGWMLLRHPPHRAKPAALAASSRPAAGASATAAPRRSAPASSVATAAPQAAASAGQSPATPTPAAAAMSAPAASGAPAAPLSPPPAGVASAPPSAAPGGGGKVWMAAGGSSPGSSGDQAPAAEGNGPVLPLYKQLASAPGATLPQLHLDLHVYATNPQKRYVMINMQKLQEGDSLPDGVRVLAIRPDGVELSYQGTRFLLPRD